MCSMINMTELKFDDKIQILSSIMTIMTLIVCLSANISIFLVTRKQKLPENCSQLKEDLKRVSYYPAFQLFRQIVTTLVLVLLREMHTIQVSIMLIISISHQFYLSQNQVHEEKSKHYITIFNEIIGVSFYIYGLAALLINENNNLQEGIGWYLASIISGVVAVNIFFAYGKIIIKQFNKNCKRNKANTVRIKTERLKQGDRTMITQHIDNNQIVVEDYDSSDYFKTSTTKQSKQNYIK